jgi:hypothetical protein
VSGQLHARPLYPQIKASCTNWEEGWVGPRTDLDALEKRKSYPNRKPNPGRPNQLPVAHGVPSCEYRIPIRFAIPEMLPGRFYGQKYFMEK